MPGPPIEVLVSASECYGAVAVFEERVAVGHGPPRHRHPRQVEVFHVLEGTFRFHLDGQELERGPGAAVVIPQGAVHAFKNVGAVEGLIHFEMIPALNSEEAFARISRGEMGDADAFAAEFGIEFVGPPL